MYSEKICEEYFMPEVRDKVQIGHQIYTIIHVNDFDCEVDRPFTDRYQIPRNR